MKAKKEFMRNVVWSNAIQGAFQRIKIYPTHWNEQKRFQFRTYLRKLVDELAIQYQNEKVSPEAHIKNIRCIHKNTKITFGVAQKLLNLYLKYLWCLDEIKYAPPHCPIDSFVLGNINMQNIRWSRMSEDEYRKVINQIEKMSQVESMPVWELQFFNRLNQERMVSVEKQVD